MALVAAACLLAEAVIAKNVLDVDLDVMSQFAPMWTFIVFQAGGLRDRLILEPWHWGLRSPLGTPFLAGDYGHGLLRHPDALLRASGNVRRGIQLIGPDEEGRCAVQWDLGLQAVGLLIAMSLGFGVIAQLVAGKSTTRWLWLIAGVTFFVSGLLISEAWFGWATEEDLQPNIDGLSFDEVLLALIPGIASVIVTRYVTRRGRRLSAGRS